MEDEDYLLAQELQEEFNREFVADGAKEKWKHREKNTDLDNTCNLVHPQWEELDPTPDVFSLFTTFDNKFFQGRLKCVTLEWSKRMYSCAGICYSRRNRLGMAITIRLSEPLLKLRPRKDLIETLIHEMIHAYCSVLGIREGNGGHGPNFKKIMHGINKVAGTNITVYHTFHDEVDNYKTHWWRCTGICQNRKPFFGYVKRTSNRAPGPNDIWWRQHLESCGGSFLKVREPEKNKPKSQKKNNAKDIRKFFPSEHNNNAVPKGNMKSNGGGTIVTNDREKNYSDPRWSSTPKKGSKDKSFGGVNKIVGLKDLDSAQPSNNKHPTSTEITGSGYSLGSSSNNSSSSVANKIANRERIRDVWAKKFEKESPKRNNNEDTAKNDEDKIAGDEKRRKLDTQNGYVAPKKDNENWTEVDDDVMFKEHRTPVIDISSDEEDIMVADISNIPNKPTPVKQSAEDRQRQIKQEIIDSSDRETTDDDIEIMDDDYNDDCLSTTAELADTSLVDDLFGEDTLLREFKKENSVASNSRYHSDPKNDIVSCPICQYKVTREFFAEHLNGCIGISVKIVPSTSKSKSTVPSYKRKSSAVKLPPENVKQALKNAGYQDYEIANALDEIDEVDVENGNRRQGLDTSTHACPVCGCEVDVDKINDHLDICLSKK